jgi:hypothetical protein
VPVRPLPIASLWGFPPKPSPHLLLLVQLARHAIRAATAVSPFTRQVAAGRWLSTYFSKDHEWVSVDKDVATVGITTFAAKALGDVVYVGLPDVGAKFASG